MYILQLYTYVYTHTHTHIHKGVDAGIPGGRLVYYDFGMMDEITGNLREGLVDLILGM
jgi:predicted unusual protein kinase regulating ubiquinone biosynthesis (AarF/ABC1/UbiB family)